MGSRIIKFKIIFRKDHVCTWYQNLGYKLIRGCVKLKINILYKLVAAKRLQGHSKIMFTRNF